MVKLMIAISVVRLVVFWWMANHKPRPTTVSARMALAFSVFGVLALGLTVAVLATSSGHRGSVDGCPDFGPDIPVRQEHGICVING